MGADFLEFAPAKINLTLRVLGRRADGYHDIESLVAFARNVGDSVRLATGVPTSFSVVGPGSAAIGDDNIAERALRLVQLAAPNLAIGAISLEKLLPIAGGVGGGSADAAAVLRLIRMADSECAAQIDLDHIARSLGADVPVCLQNEAAVMTGIGDRIAPVRLPGRLPAVLVNPITPVPAAKTARVFAALGATQVEARAAHSVIPTFKNFAAIVDYMDARENALQAPAITLMPAIDDVLEALRAAVGCRIARLSGAGPTCFGLFETSEAAKAAERSIKSEKPSWWVRFAELG
ncbi:MAG: 4-(cytidine 5'-diphospho)-2-C-methyl-D-erythritol kinase [Hyphomicrobium sp.]